MKQKKHIWPVIWAVPAVLCAIAGLIFRFAMMGYSFTAFLFFCAAGLAAFMFAVSLLEIARPRPARILRRLVAVLLVIGMALFIVAEIPVISASRGDGDKAADYLIVLGAGINGDAPSLSMINRLVAALDYLTKYPETTVVLTGGQGPGETIPESEAMRIWLERQGISSQRILMEKKSTSTYENLVFALEVIEEDDGSDGKTIAIASSEYHLFRAKQMAASLGIDAVGIPAKTTIFSLKINHFVREAFGVMHMWVFGLDVSE